MPAICVSACRRFACPHAGDLRVRMPARSAVTAGDWNGDGKLDLAVPNYFNDNVSILLNTSQ